jgi:two-component system, OmpR family, alkaline phosphatase synthesis response regulator PhoP
MDTQKPARLLLAEDDPMLLDVYKTRYEAEGFEVMTCSDGKAALEIIKEYHPDLVLLDLMMPVMSGMRALETMRKDPDIKDTKVVVISALGEEDAVDRAMALGVLGYVIKSEVPLADMVTSVRQYLNQAV